MFSLLDDSLIRYDERQGSRVVASLPEVYAALMADKVDAFSALRPHQRHAWHAFLVQLAAMAMHRASLDTPPETAEEWAGLLRGLTKEEFPDDEPWELVVDDITKPAFMQPPARSREREKDYRNTVATPDGLDMLVTSKNHDLKAEVASQAHTDDWIFALVTLQTMEGFGGAGNYGISRMNSGFGNRPAFSLAPYAGGPGAHVRRDIKALLEFRPEILDNNPHYPDDGGAALLWPLPWDGTPSEVLLPNRLDPLFVEVCRRIRLRLDSSGRLYGLRATSRAARIEGRSLKGRTGDPWTPINSKRDGVPLTLSAGGFNYKRVTDYLVSPDWGRSPLLGLTTEERGSPDPMQLVARAMVRGNGKTEGYHERVVIIGQKGPKAKSAMLGGAGSQELGDIARSRIEEVGKVQRILSHSIQTFMARGEAEGSSPEHRERARIWLNRLDEIVDATFFEDLQTEFDADASQRQGIRHRWLLNDGDGSGVINHARVLLHDAEDSLLCPAIYRYKARVNAEGLFEGRLRGNSGLPDVFNEANEEVKE